VVLQIIKSLIKLMGLIAVVYILLMKEVRWVEEDLWWEGFVEKVCFDFGLEESGSDGW